MAHSYLKIRGARQHNLKNIDLDIPRDELVVITGLSGSGKSSLAFDTIYAEGQRRYVESLSAYARQFLGQMDKPDVDAIEGLSPAVSIDQKSTTRNPRSTVGTVTEIYDHLRLLFARIGARHCHQCGAPVAAQSLEQIVDQVAVMPDGTKLLILGPVVRGRKGEYKTIIEDIRKQGFVRVRVDGVVHEIGDDIEMERYKQHTIEVVVDRVVVKEGIRSRLAESLETALKIGQGFATVQQIDGEEITFSESGACLTCGISFEELAPRSFSFNSPYGACPECMGLGTKHELDEELIMPDRTLSLSEGAILPWRGIRGWYFSMLTAACEGLGISMETPIERLSAEQVDIILHGTGDDRVFRVRHRNTMGRLQVYHARWPGVVGLMQREFNETTSEDNREHIQEFMRIKPCPTCLGKRLKPEALAVTIHGEHIAGVAAMSVGRAAAWFRDLPLSEREELIARQIVKEIRRRLEFMLNVGLDYLTLDRAAATLSGGEAQRIRLATQIGSGLMGVLYILDEPSIGLHQRDNDRLIATLQRLRDIGNTIIVVEHDEHTMRAADYVVDIGPGAGEHGGHIVAAGTPEDVMACEDSVTGQYLTGRRRISVPASRRRGNGRHLEVHGAHEHNLKNITVRFPLGTFIAITGVSGSDGPGLHHRPGSDRHLHACRGILPGRGGHHRGLRCGRSLPDVAFGQDGVGSGTPHRVKEPMIVFDLICTLFAQTPEARVRGYKPGRFSFNVKGGRCEVCKGDGIIKIEMHFLPDVYVPCEVCKGARYNRETLQVHYKGKTIADVLNMTVAEALDLFQNIPQIKRKLQTLHDVGLDYIRMGQPATTLSGGEAQRVKLATELARRGTGQTLYLLDEPTTGLHFADIERLLGVLQRLVDAGNTVMVIEHNLDVIKQADHIIDLGPEGGDHGGRIIAQGTPEDVAGIEGSYTGKYLREVLALDRLVMA
ncbi:MAG: UvrABC system protein A [Chloroflexi bacterium ADurb.Bin222]|nr:MAG: UvrABC system protein A [Chloroflexi bacterium ADurb.Bin222]